jgi:hypothetical protein
MPLSVQSLSFSGPLLKRGFWLYVWEIKGVSEVVYYVGRTGDSSSANASSPFNRVGMHFNLRPNAKGNSLIRRLRDRKLDPEQCEYRMVAIGPLFPEQTSFEEHTPYRNVVATLEYALAEEFRSRGLIVLGTHHPSAPLNQMLFANALKKINATLFQNAG